jgi:hypothetical protein
VPLFLSKNLKEADLLNNYYDGYDPASDDQFYNPGAFENNYEDDVFNSFYSIVNEVSQKARQAIHGNVTRLRENKMFDEILFYCMIFGIKLTLYYHLRKGAENGYTGDI